MRSPDRLLFSLLAMLLVGCAPGLAPVLQERLVRQLSDQAAEGAQRAAAEMLVAGHVRCVYDEVACIEQAEASGAPFVLIDVDGEILLDEEGQPIFDPEQARNFVRARDGETEVVSTGPGAVVEQPEYDFEPGVRVLFEEDYSAYGPADFPHSIERLSGDWDLVERDGERWLRNTGPRHSAVAVPLPEQLPQAFTLEFDAHFAHANQRMVVATTVPEGTGYMTLKGNAFRIGVSGGRTGIIALGGGDYVASLDSSPEVGDGAVPIRIMVDGPYAKMYVGTRRVASVPNGAFERGTAIYFENAYFASETDPMLIGPIRVAASDGSHDTAGGAR